MPIKSDSIFSAFFKLESYSTSRSFAYLLFRVCPIRLYSNASFASDSASLIHLSFSNPNPHSVRSHIRLLRNNPINYPVQLSLTNSIPCSVNFSIWIKILILFISICAVPSFSNSAHFKLLFSIWDRIRMFCLHRIWSELDIGRFQIRSSIQFIHIFCYFGLVQLGLVHMSRSNLIQHTDQLSLWYLIPYPFCLFLFRIQFHILFIPIFCCFEFVRFDQVLKPLLHLIPHLVHTSSLNTIPCQIPLAFSTPIPHPVNLPLSKPIQYLYRDRILTKFISLFCT